jgi:hypothetical protein
MSRKQQIPVRKDRFPGKSALPGGDAGNQTKGGQMDQGHRRFLVASALAPLALASACSGQPPLTRVGGHPLDPALEGLASPHFLPALS